MIEEQKAIANEILEKIEIIDKNCILAGGAPRDWWVGVLANDLDFYLYCTPENGVEHTKKSIEKLVGIKLEYLGADENYEGGMRELRAVLDGEFKGQKVQFMLMGKPTWGCVLPHFGASTSMVWYKNGRISPSPEFLLSLNKKVLYIKAGTKQAFIDKTVAKFPRLVVKTVDSIEHSVRIDNVGIVPRGFAEDKLRKLLKMFKGNL